jgi:hypothetical protein
MNVVGVQRAFNPGGKVLSFLRPDLDGRIFRIPRIEVPITALGFNRQWQTGITLLSVAPKCPRLQVIVHQECTKNSTSPYFPRIRLLGVCEMSDCRVHSGTFKQEGQFWLESYCSRSRIAGSACRTRRTGPATESDPVSSKVNATAASTNGSCAEAW